MKKGPFKCKKRAFMSERGSFKCEIRSFIYEIGGQGRSSMKTGRSSANKRAFISEKRVVHL